ncbi:gamma-glutamylcyclotransferase family protein [Streptomyces sp. NPDC051940]|uniref:gamma-glutamylcyclotransferase family protein n=1 Tax=Streptomyces sp. NPDC051940 TaxID=3155675 RepID=UPI00343F321A
MPEPAGERLPFFVYGTLRPGERYHAEFLAGRTASETPATLAGVLLYEGPGYPYAVAVPSGVVHGALVIPRPEAYEAVLHDLDLLEDGYDRVVCRAVVDGAPVRAWVYLAAEPLASRLRASGRVIEGGDWLRGAPSA